jgi:hypothetical protein
VHGVDQVNAELIGRPDSKEVVMVAGQLIVVRR